MENWISILSIILSPLSALAGWAVGKRKRNNDFISELQSSIDLLTSKYTLTLNELITLKGQNANLMIEMGKIRSENSHLKQQVEELTNKLGDVKIITRQAK